VDLTADVMITATLFRAIVTEMPNDVVKHKRFRVNYLAIHSMLRRFVAINTLNAGRRRRRTSRYCNQSNRIV